MTPQPPEDQQPKAAPLERPDAARHLEHLGMDPNAARAFAAFHSGAYASFRPRP